MKYANVIFNNKVDGYQKEIRIPLEVSCRTLVTVLNDALGLGINVDSDSDCYLISENPIAMLKGNGEVEAHGIRNGSEIIYNRY